MGWWWIVMFRITIPWVFAVDEDVILIDDVVGLLNSKLYVL